MKVNKKERQNHILSLIRDNVISTQDDLVYKLRKMDLDVTQATVSRDIKELGLNKISDDHNIQKYAESIHNKETTTSKLITVFTQAAISCDSAGSIVIIKTLPGMAGASASTIDSLDFPEVAGTIAGDDTIFIATKSSLLANHLVERLKKYIRQ
ncbi:MAG: arginine repressor [Saccharofermentanales bacterium]